MRLALARPRVRAKKGNMNLISPLTKTSRTYIAVAHLELLTFYG